MVVPKMILDFRDFAALQGLSDSKGCFKKFYSQPSQKIDFSANTWLLWADVTWADVTWNSCIPEKLWCAGKSCLGVKVKATCIGLPSWKRGQNVHTTIRRRTQSCHVRNDFNRMWWQFARYGSIKVGGGYQVLYDVLVTGHLVLSCLTDNMVMVQGKLDTWPP